MIIKHKWFNLWKVGKIDFDNVINNWNIFWFKISINNLITKINNIIIFKGLDKLK